MIAQLTGTIIRMHQNPLVVDVHDVGYAVHVPQRILTSAVMGSRITLLTYTHVREDALVLFGFSSEDELALFELLLGVSGIGPKTALSVLDRGSNAIKRAIISSDVEFFTSVPRLGKKNAQKIIIDLKSKLGSTSDLDLSDKAGTDTKQIVAALISMGFDTKEAKEAVQKLPATGTLEEKVKLALKTLG